MNIFGFVGHTISVETKFFCDSAKATIDHVIEGVAEFQKTSFRKK